jgi:putative ABC transport system permease protein
MNKLSSILFALKSHRAIAAIMLLDVALTCAIASNAANVIMARWALLQQRTGIEDARLVVVQTTLLDEAANQRFQRDRDVAILRALGGVETIAEVGSMPFMNDLAMSVSTAPEGRGGGRSMNVSVFSGSPGHLDAVGARLLLGRNFRASEYVAYAGGDGTGAAASAIVSEAVAKRMFGRESAVGKSLYLDGGNVVTVVGVVGDLLRPHPSLAENAGNHDTIVLPLLPDGASATYAVRTGSQVDAGDVAARARAALDRVGGNRVIDSLEPFEATKLKFFQKDRLQLRLLALGLVGLLAVTLVGLSGLSNYWVRQRTRSIGIRRALGATRGDVLRHFLLENVMVVGAGAILGVLFAFVIGDYLSRNSSVPALAAVPVFAAGALVCLLGQLSVLRAAIAASNVAPRIAMGA